MHERTRTTRGRTAALLAACAAAGCIGTVNRRTSEPHASREKMPAFELTPTIPYSITISGGLSLGAYEAGMNWVLVEWMRLRRIQAPARDQASPDLVGLTGASAGAINALFTAVRWCEAGKSTVESNLFEKPWREIGFEQMLPIGDDNYVPLGDHGAKPDPDFIISRKAAFQGVLDELRHRLRVGEFRPGCSVPLSLTVTKVRPGVVKVADLTATTQRYVVALIAETYRRPGGGHGMRFRLNLPLARGGQRSLLGNALWLAPRSDVRGWQPDLDQVIDAVLASSAHPSSFGPVTLRHCTARPNCPASRQHESATCEALGQELGADDYTECKEAFTDGGVFDNVPLGVAVAQAELAGTGRSTYSPRYLYMDPDQRRRYEPGVQGRLDAQTCNGEGAALAAHSLRSPPREIAEFLGGFLGAAFDYELQGVLRDLEWNTSLTDLVDQAFSLMKRKDPPSWVKEAHDAALLRARALDEMERERAKSVDVWHEGRRELLGELLGHLARAFSCSEEELLLGGNGETGGDGKPGGNDKTGCNGAKGEQRPELDALRNRLLSWRDSPRDARRLRIPTRMAPITGAMLNHFAAWVDRPFRDYDYYAGVYDGLYAVAEAECTTCDWPDKRRIMGALIADLGFSGGGGPTARANSVVTAMMNLEASIQSGLLPPVEAPPVPQLGAIMTALTDPARCAGGASCMRDCGFDSFVTSLDRTGYRPETALGREILGRGSEWWTPLARRVADRLEAIEEQQRSDSTALTRSRQVSGLVSYYWYYQTRDSWYEPPSSSRYAALRLLLPYAVVSGNQQRKLSLGLLGYGACWSRVCLVTDTSLRMGWDQGDSRDLPGGVLDDDRGRGALDWHGGVRYRRLDWALSSLQLRAGWKLVDLWSATVPTTGSSLEVDFGLLFDRVRLGVGCNGEDRGFAACHKNPFVVIGLNDLTGWATHIW